jgi:hypothetical protein
MHQETTMGRPTRDPAAQPMPAPVGGVRSRSANDPRLSHEEVLTVLRTNADRIAAATAGVDAATLRRAPAAGEWSATEILAHVRACADVWGGCIAAILTDDRPTIRAVGPRSYVHGTEYPDLAFGPSFLAFAAQRAALLATLDPLPPEAWSRTAVVTGAGAVLERTLNWYALGLAAHERSHVKQIERLAKATGDRVG